MKKFLLTTVNLVKFPISLMVKGGASQGHLVGTLLSEVGAAVGPFHPSSLYEASWGGSHFFEGKGLGKVGGFCSSGTPKQPSLKWLFGETTIFYIKIWNHPLGFQAAIWHTYVKAQGRSSGCPEGGKETNSTFLNINHLLGGSSHLESGYCNHMVSFRPLRIGLFHFQVIVSWLKIEAILTIY